MGAHGIRKKKGKWRLAWVSGSGSGGCWIRQQKKGVRPKIAKCLFKNSSRQQSAREPAQTLQGRIPSHRGPIPRWGFLMSHRKGPPD